MSIRTPALACTLQQKGANSRQTSKSALSNAFVVNLEHLGQQIDTYRYGHSLIQFNPKAEAKLRLKLPSSGFSSSHSLSDGTGVFRLDDGLDSENRASLVAPPDETALVSGAVIDMTGVDPCPKPPSSISPCPTSSTHCTPFFLPLSDVRRYGAELAKLERSDFRGERCEWRKGLVGIAAPKDDARLVG